MATTSKGDPPPESLFDSWALGALVGFVSDDDEPDCAVDVGGAATPLVVLGSSVNPALEVDAGAELVDPSSPSPSPSSVELDAVDVALIAELVRVVRSDACVLVAPVELFVLVCPPFELAVVTVTPGQRLWMPKPFWNTPMILNSPASTPAHLSLTPAPILARPCTHAFVHVAPGLKSSAVHPEMSVL